MAITYERNSPKLIKVVADGAFAGWLEQGSHKPTGLRSKRYTYWSGIIAGHDISAPTISAAKKKVEAI